MKNLKTLLGFGVIMGALMVNTTFAATGIMMSDGAETAGCVTADNSDDQTASSIIGVLIGDLQGVLIGEQPECGGSDSGVLIGD